MSTHYTISRVSTVLNHYIAHKNVTPLAAKVLRKYDPKGAKRFFADLQSYIYSEEYDTGDVSYLDLVIQLAALFGENILCWEELDLAIAEKTTVGQLTLYGSKVV